MHPLEDRVRGPNSPPNRWGPMALRILKTRRKFAADGGKSQHEGLWRESALAAEAYEDVYN
jgi:hypothetical protein